MARPYAWPCVRNRTSQAGDPENSRLPARLLPLILLPLVVAAFWQERARLLAHLPGLAVGLVVAVLVAVARHTQAEAVVWFEFPAIDAYFYHSAPIIRLITRWRISSNALIFRSLSGFRVSLGSMCIRLMAFGFVFFRVSRLA